MSYFLELVVAEQIKKERDAARDKLRLVKQLLNAALASFENGSVEAGVALVKSIATSIDG